MAERRAFKKKGGTVFPRVALEDSLGYAKKLVAKTHTGAQRADLLFPGVFGAKGARAEVRASAMKQYGFMSGSAKDGYQGTPLAKALNHAEGDERKRLLSQASLKPKVFRDLYDTFKGDTVTFGKIRQQAAHLNVHPDNVEACVTHFVDSLVFAGLAEQTGDEVRVRLQDQSDGSSTSAEGVSNSEPEDAEPSDDPTWVADDGEGPAADEQLRRPGRANIQITVTLDSTLDTDKLEKQLALLRKFGAL